jgi:hypothetical protein
MAKISKPKLIQLFENLLWVNTPKDWTMKSIYLQETLFVSISIIVQTEDGENFQKIRRSFKNEDIKKQSSDLFGMASDCVDEMKAEVK